MTTAAAQHHLGPIFEHIAADGLVALAALGLPPGAKVLDVGTGVGNFAIFLALQGFDVLTGEPATDTSRYAGHDWQANARAVGVAAHIAFQAFNAAQMPFDPNSFGAVFFYGVLHHIDQAERAAVLREALRVAGPGGAVTIFEPTQDTLRQIWSHDPGHPLAASPALYTAGLDVSERRLAGRRMDIFIYRSVKYQTA
jgi:ubiquinone/menaquinone biosynthesis C-methylase UbiE